MPRSFWNPFPRENKQIKKQTVKTIEQCLYAPHLHLRENANPTLWVLLYSALIFCFEENSYSSSKQQNCDDILWGVPAPLCTQILSSVWSWGGYINHRATTQNVKTIRKLWQRANYYGKGTVTDTSFNTFTQISGILCLY